MPTINVKYSCSGCGLYRVSLTVQARQQEPIIDWITTVGFRIGEDHSRRSPHCVSRVGELMIPITGAEVLGGAAMN